MSTPAAIVLASGAVAFAAWFLGLTRNGRHLAWLITCAMHRWLVPATGQHGLDQPAGVRDMVRDMALAAAWHMPRYWWWRKRAASLVRGCLTLTREETPCTTAVTTASTDGTTSLTRIPVPKAATATFTTTLLADPETLRSRAADTAPEEVPALEPLQGRAPGTHPYTLRETAAQPRLDEPANPARGYAPEADWTPYLPAPIGAPE